MLEKAFTHPSNDPDAIYDTIPLTFKLGGKSIKGIPVGFKRSYVREIVDANITRYEYKGICPKCGLEIKVIHTEYRDFPVSEWMAYFTNTSDVDSEIISDIMLGGEIEGEFKEFVHGNGDTLKPDGYNWWRDTLDNGKMLIQPTHGSSCRGAFPYMKLVYDSFVCRIAIGWPHMWRAELERTEEGVHFVCGQKRCNFKILSGETMRTPKLTIMMSNGDETRSMNLWRRWYMAHIIPRENGEPIKPMLCLHHIQCDGKPEFTAATEENQVSAIEAYVNKGIKPDIWWVDAGWYKCGGEWNWIGTWKPDADRFPNGLAPIGEACDKIGARFLLWFEPERVIPGTELAEKEGFTIKEAYVNPNWTQYMLNYANKDAVDFMIERIDSIIKESHIKVYRQDFNFDPQPYWVNNEAEDRLGAIENLHVQGYLRLWDEIIFRNPGLWIDACASGGKRNDLETMRRAVTLHYTDVGYGDHPIKQLQFRQMHEWIPYFRSHNMSWDRKKVEALGMDRKR